MCAHPCRLSHTFFCRSFCWGVACRFQTAHLQQFIHYLMKSCKNHGTLGILLQYVNWDACPTPEKDMKACTDALFTVLKGHYVACACKKSCGCRIPQPNVDLEGKSKTANFAFLAKLSLDVVNKFPLSKMLFLAARFMAPKIMHTTMLQGFFLPLWNSCSRVQEQLGGRKEMVTVRCWKFIFEQI